MFTKLSHFVKDLDSQKHNEFYEEGVSGEEFITKAIAELSKSIANRIRENYKGSIIKDVKIAYLIEANTHEPWFIGTEHCYLYTKTLSFKRSSDNIRR